MTDGKYVTLLNDALSTLKLHDSDEYDRLISELEKIMDSNDYMFEVSRLEDITELISESPELCRCLAIIAVHCHKGKFGE